jgi:hypothetical protein
MDYFVRIYLSLLIYSSLLFIAIYLLVWLIRGQQSLKPKYIWRNALFLITGLISQQLFNSGKLEYWGVLIVTFILLCGSVYALEAMEKDRSKKAKDNRAT